VLLVYVVGFLPTLRKALILSALAMVPLYLSLPITSHAVHRSFGLVALTTNFIRQD
jgi:hypothetical protein